jgi:hypothetical protein
MHDFYKNVCSKCANKADAVRSPIFRDEYVSEGGCKITGMETPRQSECPILGETIENGGKGGCLFCSGSVLDKTLCISDWPCNSPRKECISCGKIKVDDTYANDLIFYCDEKKCIVDIIAENELLAKAAKIVDKDIN